MGNFFQGPWGTPCGINCWLYSCWLYSFYILEFLAIVRKLSPFFTLDFLGTVRNLTTIFYLQVEFFRIFGNFKSAQWNVFLGVQDTILLTLTIYTLYKQLRIQSYFAMVYTLFIMQWNCSWLAEIKLGCLGYGLKGRQVQTKRESLQIPILNPNSNHYIKKLHIKENFTNIF